MTNAARAAARSFSLAGVSHRVLEVVNPRARAGNGAVGPLCEVGENRASGRSGRAPRRLLVLPIGRPLLDECARPLASLRAAEHYPKTLLLEAQPGILFHRDRGPQRGLRLA